MENSLVVKDTLFENFDEKDRTYHCVLTFLHGEQARLYCRENKDTKEMFPFYVAIMNGTCPCCKKPRCASFESKKEMLFRQVLEFEPKAITFSKEI